MALVKTWIRVEGSLSMVDVDSSHNLASKVVAIPVAIDDLVSVKLGKLEERAEEVKHQLVSLFLVDLEGGAKVPSSTSTYRLSSMGNVSGDFLHLQLEQGFSQVMEFRRWFSRVRQKAGNISASLALCMLSGTWS
jgi:hypothetical protein